MKGREMVGMGSERDVSEGEGARNTMIRGKGKDGMTRE